MEVKKTMLLNRKSILHAENSRYIQATKEFEAIKAKYAQGKSSKEQTLTLLDNFNEKYSDLIKSEGKNND